ncbi:MAG: permease-like cell division protein FtsX [Erysipelotrichaceae bacterium]
MFRTMGRHFKEAFYGIFRHFAMALSSASAVSITLLLVGTVGLISYNINFVTDNIEQSVQIFVKIEPDTADSSINFLEDAIDDIAGVHEIEFSSKEAELDSFISEYGEEYEMYRGASNPLRDAFYVTVADGEALEDIAGQIEDLQFVEKVNYGGENTVTMITTINTIQYAGYGVAIAFSILAIFLINNTIKITIHGRSKEISIMRHVGATNNFIRTPFVIEGIFIGILGSIIPIVSLWVGYFFLYQETGGYFLTEMLAFAPVYPTIYYIVLAILGIGVLVGLLGSFISVTRYLRFKR